MGLAPEPPAGRFWSGFPTMYQPAGASPWRGSKRRERQQGVLESGVPAAVSQGQVEEGMPWRQ